MNKLSSVASSQHTEIFSFISSPETLTIQHDQAKVIQKIFRGFQVRESFLSRSLYQEYQFACEQLNEFTPRAEDGKTVVYLPTSAPGIVIKQTGRTEAKERFFKMQAIRKVLQSEGFKNLIIPKARLYKEFLIEERVPICTNTGYNAALYLSNKGLFDVPVRQMTRLFSKAYIDYLVEINLENKSVIRIRYDNVPFLLRENQGKRSIDFALIDLERSKVGTDIKKITHKLFILVSMFPFHASIIEEEMKECSMTIGEKEKKVIEDSVVHSKRYIELKSDEYFSATQRKISLKVSEPSSPFKLNYISYEERERRFGDNLFVYLHAKWLAYQHNTPLLYKPFPYSSDLILDDIECKFNEDKPNDFEEVRFRNGINVQRESFYCSKIYNVRYFPESRWEQQNGTRHNGKPWVDYFSVDWKKLEFRNEIQKLIQPKRDLQLVRPPKDHASIAIHFREGGGYDIVSDWNLPLKFAPLDFYVEGLLKVCELFKGESIYCYLFTDAKNPGDYVEKLKERIPSDINMTFDYRMNGNSHDKNVIEDFFSLFQFDSLIYPQSNFSMVPGLIHDYSATYTFSSDPSNESLSAVPEGKLEINEDCLNKCLQRGKFQNTDSKAF